MNKWGPLCIPGASTVHCGSISMADVTHFSGLELGTMFGLNMAHTPHLWAFDNCCSNATPQKQGPGGAANLSWVWSPYRNPDGTLTLVQPRSLSSHKMRVLSRREWAYRGGFQTPLVIGLVWEAFYLEKKKRETTLSDDTHSSCTRFKQKKKSINKKQKKSPNAVAHG